LTSFTFNLTQRRPDLSIDLRQTSCLLGWGSRAAIKRSPLAVRTEKHSQNKPSEASYETSCINSVPRSQLTEI